MCQVYFLAMKGQRKMTASNKVFSFFAQEDNVTCELGGRHFSSCCTQNCYKLFILTSSHVPPCILGIQIIFHRPDDACCECHAKWQHLYFKLGTNKSTHFSKRFLQIEPLTTHGSCPGSFHMH